MPDQICMQAKGHTGQVSFDGTFVTISRKGLLARTSVGKGEKRIPLAYITAVQLKPAGPLMNGFIEFSMGGGNEGRSRFGHQTADAATNENAVVFTRSQEPQFLALRTAIENAIAARLNGFPPQGFGTHQAAAQQWSRQQPQQWSPPAQPQRWSPPGQPLDPQLQQPQQWSPPAQPTAQPPPPQPNQVPAGWYGDPYGEPVLRWWTGAQWSEHTKDGSFAAVVEAPQQT